MAASTIEIMNRGMKCLTDHMGIIEAERFISVIIRERKHKTPLHSHTEVHNLPFSLKDLDHHDFSVLPILPDLLLCQMLPFDVSLHEYIMP